MQTEECIKVIKDTFQDLLASSLNLKRVSAPLYVLSDSGLNDGLNGVESPVSFDFKSGEKARMSAFPGEVEETSAIELRIQARQWDIH